MPILGYARVSTDDQSLTLQRADLLTAGCECIFEERLSGKSLDRPALAECLASLHLGDTLVVTRIDRLARNTRDLLNIIHELDERGIGFHALLQPGMDTTSIYGKLVLQIMAAMAEFEVAMTAERRREGIERAKLAGKYVGPDHHKKVQMVKDLLLSGDRPKEVAQKVTIAGYPISERTVYRYYEDLDEVIPLSAFTKAAS